jgi:hypothetical protein
MFLKILKLLDKLRRILPFQPKFKYNLAICCIVKDEDDYLEEWINYHRKIGVQHFFIYDNGSKKPVKQIIKEANLKEYATVHSIIGKVKQLEAYDACLKHHGYLSQWIAFIDIDEFIVPKSTNGNLVEMLKDYEQFGGLGINWLLFGSSGHLEKTNRPVLERFLLRAKTDFHVNRHIKSIIQPRFVVQAAGSHAFFFKKNYHCVNENYITIHDSFADVSIRKIHINHYYCKSLEEYHNKIERGLPDTER